VFGSQFDEYVGACALFGDAARYSGVDKRHLRRPRKIKPPDLPRVELPAGLVRASPPKDRFVPFLPPTASRSSPFLKILSDRLGHASPHLARNPIMLPRVSLTDPQHLPAVFGRADRAYPKLGSASLDRYERKETGVVALGGKLIPLGAFIADLCQHYAALYLFQKRFVPHASVPPDLRDRLPRWRLVDHSCETAPGEPARLLEDSGRRQMPARQFCAPRQSPGAARSCELPGAAASSRAVSSTWRA